MHGSREQTATLIKGLAAALAAGPSAEVAVCPPFVYLVDAAAALKGTGIRLGAQNLAVEEGGAYTGEVAGPMLRDVGCHYAIVGHSERRSLYGETDELVAAKYRAAQRDGLVPILCVGETLEERDGGGDGGGDAGAQRIGRGAPRRRRSEAGGLDPRTGRPHARRPHLVHEPAAVPRDSLAAVAVSGIKNFAKPAP